MASLNIGLRSPLHNLCVSPPLESKGSESPQTPLTMSYPLIQKIVTSLLMTRMEVGAQKEERNAAHVGASVHGGICAPQFN